MIYQILRIAVDLSRQMLFLETYYQSLEQQREYYHVNKNVDAKLSMLCACYKYLMVANLKTN